MRARYYWRNVLDLEEFHMNKKFSRVLLLGTVMLLGLWADSGAQSPAGTSKPAQRFVPSEHIHADKVVDFPVDI